MNEISSKIHHKQTDFILPSPSSQSPAPKTSINPTEPTKSTIELGPIKDPKTPKKIIINGPSINLLFPQVSNVKKIDTLHDENPDPRIDDEKVADSHDFVEPPQSNNSRYVNSSNSNVNRRSSIDSLGGISEQSTDSD